MINVIICDDNDNYRNKIVDKVKKFMAKNELECEIHEFNDYAQDFNKIIQKPMPGKIYILDIETPTRSGIDIARIIRKIDVNSIIIFLTGHEELGQVILRKDIMFLSFINKFDNCDKRLNNSLKTALEMLDKKQIIKFSDTSATYTINRDTIHYIIKDTMSRKCIVKTDNREYVVGMTLSDFMKLLPNDFVQSHKSCIVNKRRVVKTDPKERIIVFDDGEQLDLLSRKYKKEFQI